MHDLTRAVVTIDGEPTDRLQQAATVLREEVARRAQMVWPPTSPGADAAVIVLRDAGTARREGPRWSAAELASFRATAAVARPEGFAVQLQAQASGGAPAVTITGNDERGVLYGVGWLLRHLEVRRLSVQLPAGVIPAAGVVSAPSYPLRGHQIGYRPKTNSYVGWTAAEWDRYIRELALFGANAVEVIPPRSDDLADSDHFPLPQIDMLAAVAASADRYGLDVWVWYPALDKDYGDAATVDFALREWRQVFERMSRIDALFVPGGDPGSTPAPLLLALIERQKASLNEVHADAQMWIAPQGFHGEDEAAFYAALESGVDWLDGVIFGPWIHLTAAEIRARVPERYPLRYYPDITHCWSCQYPVPEWDTALAACHGREPINPRPRDQQRIFALNATATIGALTYCEGNNDDVNKVVWSALLWDPDADVHDVLRQYGRVFVHPDLADGFAAALFDLERNWRGPLIANAGVETTLQRVQTLERTAPPRVLKSWRLLQVLYRAYADAYIRERLLVETAAQVRAIGELRRAEAIGALTACRRAAEMLDGAAADARSGELRARVYALAEALFQNIHVQLSVSRYGAQAVRRGASIDGLEYPLNDRLWLHQQFAAIGAIEGEPQRIQAIDAILRRADPGPGGRYDNLGVDGAEPHLTRGPGFVEDPSFLRSALRGFSIPYPPAPIPYAWLSQAESIGDGPLELRYDGLDPAASYRLVVVYGGEAPRRGRSKVRLEAVTAAGAVEIHGLIAKTEPIAPVTFDVPAAAVADTSLTLRCYHEQAGGPGRGAQINEVWLERSDRKAREAVPRERGG